MTLDDPYELALSYDCDEATATELAEILNGDRSRWRTVWLERLQSAEWVDRLSHLVPQYLDPAYQRRVVAGNERLMDPNDPDNIRLGKWLEAGRAGAKSTVVEVATGKVVSSYTLAPTTTGDASYKP